MFALLDTLESEPEAIVRAVMGHWLFGFIHPYMDGNGRMTRFLMNLMMASGGYPWTIVRTARKKPYLDALEVASAEQNIIPFVRRWVWTGATSRQGNKSSQSLAASRVP